MQRERVELEPAWVLRTQPYSDTSLLVEVFAARHGRVGLVARGVRSPKSRSRALLQPFRPLALSWTGGGELGALGGVEPDGAPVALDGEAVFSGWYLNELLLRLLQRHDPHPQLSAAYGAALRALPAGGEIALRRFELVLLAELGFGIEWPEDLAPGLAYRFVPDSGLVPCAALAAGALAAEGLAALRDDRVQSDAERTVARRLLRAALAVHLGDRPLASARVLRELRAGRTRRA